MNVTKKSAGKLRYCVDVLSRELALAPDPYWVYTQAFFDWSPRVGTRKLTYVGIRGTLYKGPAWLSSSTWLEYLHICPSGRWLLCSDFHTAGYACDGGVHICKQKMCFAERSRPTRIYLPCRFKLLFIYNANTTWNRGVHPSARELEIMLITKHPNRTNIMGGEEAMTIRSFGNLRTFVL